MDLAQRRFPAADRAAASRVTVKVAMSRGSHKARGGARGIGRVCRGGGLEASRGESERKMGSGRVRVSWRREGRCDGDGGVRLPSGARGEDEGENDWRGVGLG